MWWIFLGYLIRMRVRGKESERERVCEVGGRKEGAREKVLTNSLL